MSISKGEALHNWNLIGPGEFVCSHCHKTNRELALFGDLSQCNPPSDDLLLLSLKKLTFCLQEWDHFPETMPKAYDQQPRHVQMLMDLIQEHEEDKPYG